MDLSQFSAIALLSSLVSLSFINAPGFFPPNTGSVNNKNSPRLRHKAVPGLSFYINLERKRLNLSVC